MPSPAPPAPALPSGRSAIRQPVNAEVLAPMSIGALYVSSPGMCAIRALFRYRALSPNTLNLRLHGCKMPAWRGQGSRRAGLMAAWRTGSRSVCWRRRSPGSWLMRLSTRPGRGSGAGGCPAEQQPGQPSRWSGGDHTLGAWHAGPSRLQEQAVPLAGPVRVVLHGLRDMLVDDHGHSPDND